MNKILFTLLIGLTISFTAHSQKNIGDYFVDMPLYLIPTLESSYRLELVENYQTSGKDTVQNMFSTTVRLLSLDTINQHIKVQTTDNSRFEMQLFKQKNDTLIGIINTVCAPICSSYIKFFDTEWKEVKVDFPKYNNKSWYKHSISDEAKKNIDKLVKVSFIELNFNPENQEVEVKNNTLEYLNESDKAQIIDDMTTVSQKVPFSKLGK